MIECQNISYLVKGKRILDNVSFQMNPGELVGIIGKNGAGKSTLLKLLSGQIHPSEGLINFEGKNIKKYSPNELAKKRAILSQHFSPILDLSILDIILFGRHPYRPLGKKDFKIVDELLESFDLWPLRNVPFLHLSGGEKQKVQFVRTLAQLYPLDQNEKKYLFLDEPISALDLNFQQKILMFLSDLVSKKSLGVFIILHDLNWVARHCHQVHLFESGKIIKHGSPDEVLTCENLKDHFGVVAEVIKNKEKNNFGILYH